MITKSSKITVEEYFEVLLSTDFHYATLQNTGSRRIQQCNNQDLFFKKAHCSSDSCQVNLEVWNIVCVSISKKPNFNAKCIAERKAY